MSEERAVTTRGGRLRRFQRAYNQTCERLDSLGIPFWNDPCCRVFYDDAAVGSNRRPAISYHWGGEIVICREHVERSMFDAQLTLVHELTHYWCERFPTAMRRAHTFRVPRKPLAPTRHPGNHRPSRPPWRGLDAHNEHYVGAYSQVDSEECLAEFMAHQVVCTPDLRAVRSEAARKRFRACRQMLRRLKALYRD